jgi:hypothetical protein
MNASIGEHTVEGEAYYIQNVNAYDSRLKNWMRMHNCKSNLTSHKVLVISTRRCT